MANVIVFTSGKGGVGKTNLCLNTALQLTAEQRRTCLFDGDLGLANVNILLGIDQEHTLDDVVSGRRTLPEIIVQTGYGFDIIPGSSGVERIADLSGPELEALIDALAAVDDYEYFLIDTASGISRGVISFCLAARLTIIVITAETTSLTDAYALLKVLHANGYQGEVRILVNDCGTVTQAKQTYLRYKKVVDKHLGIAIAPAGIVLHDDHFEHAVAQQKPVLELFPECIGAQCIRAFVANLIRDNGTETSSLSSFWQRYLELLTGSDPGTPRPESAVGREDAEPDEEAPAGPDPTARSDESGSNGRPAPPLTDRVVRLDPATAGALSAGRFHGYSVLLAAGYDRITRGDLSMAGMRQLIASDPVLLVMALQTLTTEEVAASPVDGLEAALAGVGEAQLYPLLLQAGLHSLAAEDSRDGDYRSRWRRSYQAAHLARDIAGAVGYAHPEEAYAAGLLHDIGGFAIDGHDDPSRTAAGLLAQTGFSSFTCDAVRFQSHRPERIRTAFALVRIVYTAAALAGSNGGGSEVDPTILELVPITTEQAAPLRETAAARLRQAEAEYGLNDTGDTSGTGRLGRQLMVDLLMHGIMPPVTPTMPLADWVRRLHRSVRQLFGFDRVICFLTDAERGCLAATGFPGCFRWRDIDSLVVPAGDGVLSSALTASMPVIDDLLSSSTVPSLADQQLKNLFGTDAIACIPLRSRGVTSGLIVCGVSGPERDLVVKDRAQLASLGCRAARDLAVINRTAG